MKVSVAKRKARFEKWYSRFVPTGAQRYRVYLDRTKEKQLYYKNKPQPLPNGTKISQNINLALYPEETTYEFHDPSQLIPLYDDCPRQRFADDGSFHSGLGYYMLWLRISNPYRWYSIPFLPEDNGRRDALENNGFPFLSIWEGVMSKVEKKQLIVYGAPGTGKSFFLQKEVGENEVVRTTFHPDADYSTFVGAYKPTMTSTGGIAYDFVPQAFINAYVKAWQFKATGNATTGEKPVFLLVEEINRGNCAQIFGDLFQLLDRADNGWSAYPIDADNDLMRYLGKEMPDLSGVSCPDGYKAEVWEKIKSGEKLALPPNLYIWATMNTSDQSLFPIDSAFKRRWDWEYSPIKDCPEKDYLLTIGGSTYKWWSFVKAINDRIWCATDSEDKKLGYFFVKAKKDGDGKNVIDAEKFLNKVVFYLWNDVFKNSEPERAFKFEWPDGNSRLATFQNFFKEVDGTRDDDMLKAFLKGLGVKTKVEEDADGAGANPPSSEEAVAQDVASVPDAGGTPSDTDGSSSAETENVAVEPA